MFIVNPHRYPAPGGPVTSGLIGRWPFAEGSGEYTEDISVSNNDGSLQNMSSANWITGPNGLPALAFDGTNERVYMGNPRSFDGLSAISICAFINGVDVSPFGVIIGKYSPQGNHRSFYLAVSGSGPFGLYSPNGADVVYWSADSTLSAATDHHIAATMDLASGAGALYVDGVEQSAVKTGSATGAIHASSADFLIGCIDNDIGYKNYFEGEIADVRIYDRILSAAEVRSISDGVG